MKTRLMVASSERDANMLYATRLFAPDPFIWFETRGKSYVVMNDLEIDRARKQATVDRVLSFTRYQKKLRSAGVREPRFADILNCVLREFRVRNVEVPAHFPIGFVRKLRGIRVTVKPEPFFPEREIKTPSEIVKLVNALRLSEEAMGAALDVLRTSHIGRGKFLYWRKQKLTAECVQGVIHATIAGLGGTAAHTIVACGNRGCDPHETGYGPLRAHTPIMIDIFPRDTKTGYFGDITRTVVRGRASDAVKKMYTVVGMAQKLAFQKMRAGVDGKVVHNAVLKFFTDEGFRTGRVRGRMQGFFHGTGHGLGLEVHERPHVGGVSDILRAGHVVTVEPGLYYPGIGGVRLEDVVVIQEKGARNLTRFPKMLEI